MQDASIIWHDYGRPKAPKLWSGGVEGWGEGMAKSKARVRDFLKGEEVEGLSAGNVRTLQEYWEFVGTDPVSQKNTTRLC